MTDSEERDDFEPQAEEPADDEMSPTQNEEGDFIYPDGFRATADGRYYNADDEEITAEEFSGAAEPEEPRAEPERMERAAPPEPQYTGIWTADNIYTEQERDMLARLDLENPNAAAAFRFEKLKALDNYAQDRFDADLDRYAAEAPEVVARYSRQIERARRRMTVEQLQAPGAARTLVSLVAAEEMARDPKRLEAFLSGKPVAPVPAAPPPERRPARPLPPEKRAPTSGGSRRVVSRPAGENDRLLESLRASYPGIKKSHVKLLLGEEEDE